MNEAPTYDQFIVSFPEFGTLPQTYVQDKLDSADRLLSKEAFGDLYFDAVGYHTAHTLAVSPFGQQNAVDADAPEDTIYSIYYKRHIAPRSARRGLVF